MKVDLIVEKDCLENDPNPEEVQYGLILVNGEKRVEIDMFGLNIELGTVMFPLNNDTADLVGVSTELPTYAEYEELIARLKKESE